VSTVKRTKHIDYAKFMPIVRDEFLQAAGIAIARQAKELAPVDTGLLRASINWSTPGNGGGLETPAGRENELSVADKDTAKIGTNVEYAEYMEYGTARFPTGKPFLRVAARVMKKELKSYLMAALKKAEKNAK